MKIIRKATGFFGKTGRGTEEFLNLENNRVHIVNSTLGKALGGAAGNLNYFRNKFTFLTLNINAT